ncbi:MAG: T9SS type A sorting domain-containing protein [Crocinitomicaceae bacterium]|nr:T9SS type A sorting domain-containing protein [Crocinitomicaceae bacterium]
MLVGNMKKVSVIDINGTLVKQFEPASIYPADDLNAGIYLITVLTKKGISTHGLVKM